MYIVLIIINNSKKSREEQTIYIVRNTNVVKRNQSALIIFLTCTLGWIFKFLPRRVCSIPNIFWHKVLFYLDAFSNKLK